MTVCAYRSCDNEFEPTQEAHRFCSSGHKNRQNDLDRGKKRDKTSRAGNLRKQYKISEQQYDDMMLAQDGRCSICSSDEPGQTFVSMPVDHSHKTGKVRALLCGPCNNDIGGLESLMDRNVLKLAIDYLEEYENN